MLADRLDTLDVGAVLGELETLRFRLWTAQTTPAPPVVSPPSRGLGINEVMERTGMSKDWLYREARAGRLPFARHHGRRWTFDEAGLGRWQERRR